jgi:integrase
MTAAALALQTGPDHDGHRRRRDRLELLTALIGAPSFDALFRDDIIQIPPLHPMYSWRCAVGDCERPRWGKDDLCCIHAGQCRQAQASGVARREFLTQAQPLPLDRSTEERVCRICKHRPAASIELELCARHRFRWRYHRGKYTGADFEAWILGQRPCPSYGTCVARVCTEPAATPLGFCPRHAVRYARAGRPGAATVPSKWQHIEFRGEPVPVSYRDRAVFRHWCTEALPVVRIGQLNVLGLPPLLRAELRWGLHTQARSSNPPWNVARVQAFIDFCQRQGLTSVADADPLVFQESHRQILKTIQQALLLVYASPADTRDAGYLETEHFGVRFPARRSRLDLGAVSQKWLRDMLWDFLAETLRSPACPRTLASLDAVRKACTELSAFLRVDAPGGGDEPNLLQANHMHRYVADLKHREQHGLHTLTIIGLRGKPTVVHQALRRNLLNHGRRLLRSALETGVADQLGLDRGFITAMPAGGHFIKRTRSPFPDDIARALAAQDNLARLGADYDPSDHGLRDIWETIVFTGRRASEVINLRLDCVDRYNDLPLLWHDQTKVGNYDAAVRIPEHVHDLIRRRQQATLAKFADRHSGRMPTTTERERLALFPNNRRASHGQQPMSYSWFQTGFSQWVQDLDIGRHVAHQARHTMATRLLRHGATLTHVRRYLGHVSDRMAEHYIKVAVSEIEDVLQHVWVTGPGAPNPGQLISSDLAPLDRVQAEALALDLSRRSTPTEGGLCTFQPVVNGDACPWKLNCEGCDKFVLTGADLLYWRRKREQWASIAERAPDPATADYLHQVFAPTARAIDGLEQALAALGLLDDALALDMRRPQDYFQRLWNIGFRAADLAEAAA